MVLVGSCMFEIYRKVASLKVMMMDVNLDEEELSPTQFYQDQMAIAGWATQMLGIIPSLTLHGVEPPHSRLLGRVFLDLQFLIEEELRLDWQAL